MDGSGEAYGVMFLGHFEPAIDAVTTVQDSIPDELVRLESPAMVDRSEGYMSIGSHALARAALKEHGTAADAQRNFKSAAAAVPEKRRIHAVPCQGILGVAREVLAGEIAYHAGEYVQTFHHHRNAVRREDELPYDKPWGRDVCMWTDNPAACARYVRAAA